MKKTFNLLLFLLSINVVFFTGCSKIDDIKVNMGLKNTDFEFIKQNKVQKVIIQSTRDKGFRFVVTDKNTIKELYDILSSAKATNEKSTYEPDYIFEMDEGSSKVHKFSYVAGIGKKTGGNLYSQDKIYVVSQRLDNDIIKSFWDIRKPKDFNQIYYSSIIETMNQYFKTADKNKKIGINLEDDVEAAKFILSIDLLGFNEKLNDLYKGVQVVNKNREIFDTLITIKTQGYKATSYKALVTIRNKQEKSEKRYYILNKYESGRWDMKVSEEKPDSF